MFVPWCDPGVLDVGCVSTRRALSDSLSKPVRYGFDLPIVTSCRDAALRPVCVAARPRLYRTPSRAQETTTRAVGYEEESLVHRHARICGLGGMGKLVCPCSFVANHGQADACPSHPQPAQTRRIKVDASLASGAAPPKQRLKLATASLSAAAGRSYPELARSGMSAEPDAPSRHTLLHSSQNMSSGVRGSCRAVESRSKRDAPLVV